MFQSRDQSMLGMVKKHKEACKWGRCKGLRYVVRKGKGGTDCVEMGGTEALKGYFSAVLRINCTRQGQKIEIN